MAAFLNGCLQTLKGFLPKAFRLDNLITVLIQRIKICKCPNPAMTYKLLQRFFRQASIFILVFSQKWTNFRTSLAEQCGFHRTAGEYRRYFPETQHLATAGTIERNTAGSGLIEVLCNLRNDHVRLIHADFITTPNARSR